MGRRGYAERRGAQRDAGTDERLVTNAGGASTHLVSDRSGILLGVDTYWLAV
jgi:hypothetical protein